MKATALEWQREIYLNGFAGKRLLGGTNFAELENRARRALDKKAFAYIAGGAGNERTMHDNITAFSRQGFVPRVLNNVGERDTSVTLFGKHLPSPFLISPIGVLDLAHPEADLAVARAASRLNIPFIFSNQASKPMEECARVMHDAPRWFQLYWSKSNELVESFVRRAEGCGCAAIVVTLDTTMLGWRPRDLDLGYLPFLEGRGIAQYTSDPYFQKMLDLPEDAATGKRDITVASLRGLVQMVNNYPGSGFFRKLKSKRPMKAVQKFITTYSNPCTNWNDLSFLKKITRLPIVLKGVLHPDDALRAIDHGMDGIIVSNHGGRQVDGAIAALDALSPVVRAVNGKIPILMDSGIRGGADALKAIALGASAVCVGRPYVYGLAVGGEQGVYEVLRNYLAEFELTMGLCGCSKVAEIDGSLLTQQG